MSVVGNPERFSELFPDDFLEDIIGRMLVAWEQIERPITAKREPQITLLLRHKYISDTVIKGLFFRVQCPHTLYSTETGEVLGQPDLCLLHGNNEDCYFAFECKRLNVTDTRGQFATLAGKYVGSEGIGRFVSQKYAKGHQHAGMIGYVVDGKIDKAKSAINKQLKKKSTQLLLKPKQLVACSFDPSNNQLAKTTHKITPSMTIHHVFLPIS